MGYLLQHLLSDAAERAPEARALQAPDGTLSYRELDRLSTQLSRTLRAVGVQPGDRVGLLARKSAAAVIGLFAVLKVAACYVPLDPASPDERLSLILGDSRITVVLADEANQTRALGLIQSAGGVHQVIALGSSAEGGRPGDFDTGDPAQRVLPWSVVLREPAEPAEPVLAIDTDLAYMLYTSGSTGAPKGVMISHRASLTFVEWAAACAELDERDRVCSPAPLHFDLSVFDIFGSCRAGACMVITPTAASMFPVRLAEWIEQEEVTVWYSVPSLLTMLATHGNLPGRDLSRLRMVIFAGEVFPAKHLSLLMEQLPHVRHLNWFGPTETNVCTWYEVPGAEGPRAAPVPIGRPCSNVDVFAVTNGGGRVSAPGEEGELFVRGSGLMSGYWGLAEKTRQVLVRNPLQDAYDEPVYRTGDIVTLDEAGNYVFLGRRDGMVKTRGYRVELGEVETALYAHSDVREAVVLPVPDDLLGNRLRAVITVEDGAPLSRSGLLEHCRHRLPAYMVPDTVEIWEALPKTSTGKVDRVMIAGRSGPATGDRRNESTGGHWDG